MVVVVVGQRNGLLPGGWVLVLLWRKATNTLRVCALTLRGVARVHSVV